MTYTFVLIVGLAAGALSSVLGTGSSIMLLPILVYQFGPKQAVPIMAVSALMLNVAKVAAWWREVDCRAFAAYSVPGVPAAAIGARTLLALPSHLVDVALGGFFLVMIPARRCFQAHRSGIRLWHLALAGATIVGSAAGAGFRIAVILYARTVCAVKMLENEVFPLRGAAVLSGSVLGYSS